MTLYGSETKHEGMPPQAAVPQWSSMSGPNQASSVLDCPSRVLSNPLVACSLRIVLNHLGMPGTTGETFSTSRTAWHSG